MIVKGCASISQLQKISIFQDLAVNEFKSLIPYSYIREYQQQEIVMQEGDRLPQQLHALISGKLEIKKTGDNGKETIVRFIPQGEIFAAPAMFGNGIAPAMVVCQVFNQRLQQLHNTVHGLISERAIVRLIRLLQYYSHRNGTQTIAEGELLQIQLPYYQLARSIGISYEETPRAFIRQIHR